MPRLNVLILIFTLWPLALFAQNTSVALGGLTEDSSAPIEIASDNLSVDQATGKAVFQGNVVIGQGNLRLSANRVNVTYSNNGEGISKLEASGGVTFVTETEAAEAQNAVYSLDSRTIVMTGNVLLTQGASAISSNRMVVDLDSNTAQLDGRVRTILQQGGN